MRKIVLQGKSKEKTLKKNIISLKENSEQLKKMWLNIQGAMQALKKYESERKSTLNLNWTEGLNECWLKQLIKKSVKNLKIDLKKLNLILSR
ncbi:hypothetical protein FC19_GL000058 [Liquorilactobacillus aquaticus DSM 21051]|uniref:Uncharacterized protein n=1 Tax=Liquorilactobacillus aquaticus DSM 21051 TaxID=1423725 RepID=A0A0R2CT69_9LACO|nr:hypothetical protein FC19_GL000058 [Liquorilactobacillus aquaticus DSM 21051]